MHATLQASLRAALRDRRDVESIGPFLATFDPDSDSPFRNYAVPDDGARPTPEEVEDLRRAFVRRGRLPRLEFLPAAALEAEATLLQAGFVTEARLPIMTCAPTQLRELAPPPGIRLDVAVGSDALGQAAAIQNAAYGAPEPTATDVARPVLPLGPHRRRAPVRRRQETARRTSPAPSGRGPRRPLQPRRWPRRRDTSRHTRPGCPTVPCPAVHGGIRDAPGPPGPSRPGTERPGRAARD